MKIRQSLMLCALLLALPLLGHAEIYKWKDKNGAIRYTDTPPPSGIRQEAIGKKKTVEATVKAPSAPVEGASPVADKDAKKEDKKEAMSKEDEAAQIRQRNAEAEKRNKQEKEAEAKRKAENCKAAKSNFETYTQGGRVYKMNEKGEREYMGDNDLKDGKAKAQSEIDENC